jgi:uncharacterized membrane protein
LLTHKKRHLQADAICEGTAKIGQILAAHFTIKPDDADELKGVITGD